MIDLWELGGEGDRRYSTFSWRTRMALRHKGLDFNTHTVLQTDKDAIAFSGGTTVTVLRDEDTVIRDSWAIACHLEKNYPARPSLFGGDAGLALTHFTNTWVDRVIIPAAFATIACDAIEIQHPDDRLYFGDLIQKFTSFSASALKEVQPDNVQRLYRAADPARATLKKQAFLSGAQAAYADYALFGVYQWARIVSPLNLLAEDAVLSNWFDQLLDLHDGFARETPTR